MKIVFFGIPDLGLFCFNALIERKKNLIAVVPPLPSHPSHNLMVTSAKQQGIPSVFFNRSPKEADFIDSIRKLEPDLCVVCAFDHKLPQELLEIPKLGFINCHPSLLPEYRGGNPYFHVIANGEKKTGITIHYMDSEFDTGDIILQWFTDIPSDETFGTLFNRLNFQAANLMADTVDKFEKGVIPERKPQIKSGNFKKAPSINPEKGHVVIDWSKSSVEIERFVRACNPIFGATAYFRGCMIRIWSGTYNNKVKLKNATPGSIAGITSDGLAIATGDGIFMPAAMQVGYYMITDIKDFIRRTDPQIGEMFESGK